MKLIIQIPCKNEEENLGKVLSELPKHIDGVDIIEYQVIDDGSTDKTFEVAKNAGIHHIIKFNKNRGLGFGFKAGVENALSLGADILVNTDADNQYPSKYIKDLVRPIIEKKADIVIGNRKPTEVGHFKWYKKYLQGLGNVVLSFVVSEKLPDSVSGFRAYSRESLYELNVTTKFSYVIDTIIQAYKKGLKIDWVDITTNLPTRPSRLFKNIFEHIKKSTISIFRVYIMYEPLKVFLVLSLPFLITGFIGIFRFVYIHFFVNPLAGLLQSLIISGALITIGISLFSLGIIGDLIAKNRFLIEENLKMSKKMKYEKK
ncbi:MAG: glycosyltransferase family 2 protein [Candidatus Gracilibacteria bacterium]|nr:glycosyltransferase family 2 protein [Candidatus Gracilibacteria bacterium]